MARELLSARADEAMRKAWKMRSEEGAASQLNRLSILSRKEHVEKLMSSSEGAQHAACAWLLPCNSAYDVSPVGRPALVLRGLLRR